MWTPELFNHRRLALAVLALFVTSVCVGWATIAVAQSSADEAEPPESSGGDWQSQFSYGSKGLQFETPDGNNFLWFGVRLQTRFSTEDITQDLLPGDPSETDSEVKLNRGRFKLGGHLINPDFAVYTEYDFPTGRLIDFRGTYRFSELLSLRVGQWKAEFNRERRDSSGNQQFAERSISTPWFTIDRQLGLVASGRFAKETAVDSSYWFGRLSGAGRGGSLSEADGLWFGRYQWNFAGRVLDFSQSDIARRQEGAGSVAFAAVGGKTAYTSFSSAGGGQLPGYEDGGSDRYDLQQYVLETAWQHLGFSWQQELHWKRIIDREVGEERILIGGYAQAGIFANRFWASAPEPLELAIRYAYVDPDDDVPDDYEREFTIGGNWFFDGHRNKLTADVSYIQRRFVPESDKRLRFRFQWDVSF